MRAECVDPVENRANFPKLIFMVVIKNGDVIIGPASGGVRSSELIEAAQGRADPRPMGWLLPVAKPQGSRLVALGVARRKVAPKFDEGLKSAHTHCRDHQELRSTSMWKCLVWVLAPCRRRTDASSR